MPAYPRPPRHSFQTWDGNNMKLRYSGHNQSRRYSCVPPESEATPYDSLAYTGYAWGGPLVAVWNNHCDTMLTECSSQPAFSKAWPVVTNGAYSKFKEKVRGNTLSLGNYFSPEGKQAVEMISNRALQLVSIIRRLKKGDVVGAFYASGLRPPPQVRRYKRSKKAADWFLEMHFGWSPLIQDIHDAVDFLQQSTTDKWQSVFGQASLSVVLEWGTPGYNTFKCYGDALCRVRQTAQYRISDPNRFRANQLGLINPAAIVWENVPFSFVVDWFLPVSDFLESWSDFVGLEFRNPCYTRSIVFNRVKFLGRYGAIKPGTYGFQVEAKGLKTQRIIGMISPTILPKWTRGITVTQAKVSIALLVQQLSTIAGRR